MYFGPRRDCDPRWVPAIVTKCKGTRTLNVCVCLCGPTWRRHIEQLQPRYVSEEDNKPGEDPQYFLNSRVPSTENTTEIIHSTEPASDQKRENATEKHGSNSLRHSKRTYRLPKRFGSCLEVLQARWKGVMRLKALNDSLHAAILIR